MFVQMFSLPGLPDLPDLSELTDLPDFSALFSFNFVFLSALLYAFLLSDDIRFLLHSKA